MQKPTRLAACEPCRQMKLACDHRRPYCSRCVRQDRGDSCNYRDRPFKKRRRLSERQAETLTHSTQAQDTTPEREEQISPTRQIEVHQHEHRYPNPGYLGLSSHATIFGRIPTDDGTHECSPARTTSTSMPMVSCGSHSGATDQQVQLLKDVVNAIDVQASKNLIAFWHAKGINLEVGGSLVTACIDTLQQLSSGALCCNTNPGSAATRISESSNKTLVTPSDCSFKDFCDQFCGTNIRWETIALALIALGRASMDIQFFPPLYTDRKDLQSFQRKVTSLSDKCLEIVLSFDCLNDLQLVSQYESWILHSVVDGDQSFNSWRRLGDVVSSLLFLGYHEEIISDATTPFFRAELRRAAFAQVYSDDKNIAVFLGRPPRLNRNFCFFQLPSGCSVAEEQDSPQQQPPVDGNTPLFAPTAQMNHVNGIRWTASCAYLKEEILEIVLKHNKQLHNRAQQFKNIRDRAENLWSSLPTHLKLEGSLNSCETRTPFEKDFLLNVRLTYLQVLFLLANGEFTQRDESTGENDVTLLKISQEMLSLVVEAIVLRGYLVNSGTSLVWKAAHYGLPAAGSICLSMLRPSFGQTSAQSLQISKIIQDLSVFVAEIQIGGLVQAGEPNYALLHRATSTIEALLKAKLSSEGLFNPNTNNHSSIEHDRGNDTIPMTDVLPANSLNHSDFWGFEYDFWQSLGEHPSLSTSRGFVNLNEWQ